ncbi:Putative periplasmic or exported protein [Salmonella bongori]|nr:Putative periplasmic or exported protein [Salmonella bongori]
MVKRGKSAGEVSILPHADFMNGWTEDGAQFMTDLCMNQGLDCGTMVPYAYRKAEENTWVSSDNDKPHAGVDTLYVQDDWTNGGRTQHPETLTLVKFKIPPPACQHGRFAIPNTVFAFLAVKQKRTAPIRSSFTRPAMTGTSVPCHGTINRRSLPF